MAVPTAVWDGKPCLIADMAGLKTRTFYLPMETVLRCNPSKMSCLGRFIFESNTHVQGKVRVKLTGIGLYTFSEAARLTRIPLRDLRRWLRGNTYADKVHDRTIEIPPLWDSELAGESIDGISFHDLLEVRFVQAFRQHGVSLQTIRVASRKARELFDIDYPFTAQRFQTDGRTIFASALEETGETELLDLVKGQYAFRRVIEPSLYHGIEFGTDEAAKRWFPSPRSRAVVLDPEIAFGKPIVTDVGIRTSVLYASFLAESDKEYVARLYEVPVAAVESAIAFEERLAA